MQVHPVETMSTDGDQVSVSSRGAKDFSAKKSARQPLPSRLVKEKIGPLGFRRAGLAAAAKSAGVFRAGIRWIGCCSLGLWVLGLATLSLAQTSVPNSPPPQPPRPNIVVIMADDVGFGDLSCYGATAVRTPELDSLATQGRRFTAGYASAATCTPTRYSLLTGQYAFRQAGTGVAPPNSPCLIPAHSVTLASQFQAQGYRTGMIGKWHLGLGNPPGPDWNGSLDPGPCELGFDYSFILPTTNDRVPQVFVENRRVRNLDESDPLWVGDRSPGDDHPTGLNQRPQLRLDWDVGHNGTIHNGISRIGFYTGGLSARFRDEDLTDHWMTQCREFIDARGEHPFFLLYASHNIHVPRTPHERFQGHSSLGSRGDAIVELDWSVGELRRLLEARGIWNDTLIIFCSDNGPVLNDGYRDQAAELNGDHRPAGPFRDGKYSVYEGGTRTPFIVHWPTVVPPSESGEVVCTVDLAASLSSLIGQAIPAGAFPDSQDLGAALWGNGRGRDVLVTQGNQGLRGALAIRAGDWKLIRKPAAQRPSAQSDGETVWELYNLAKDPGEVHNAAAAEPLVLARLRERLEEEIKATGTLVPRSADSKN